MNKTLLGILVVVIIALTIAGIVFITTATQDHYHLGAEEARIPALVGGITCLVLGVGLLIFAIVFSRKNP